jgi:hypothetical protein
MRDQPHLSHGWAFYSGGSNGDNNGPQICSPASPSIGDGRLNRECQTSVVCFPVRVPPPSYPACPDLPNSRQKGQAGFTRSSTTASASLPGGAPKACGCSPAMATISWRAFRRLSTRSRVCRGDHVSWTVRPSWSTNAASRYSTLSGIGFDHAAVLCAFDLIELDGEDLRWARLEPKEHAGDPSPRRRRRCCLQQALRRRRRSSSGTHAPSGAKG